MHIRLLSVVTFLLAVAFPAVPAPIRGDKDWSIHPQPGATDWQDLVTGPNLAAGRPLELRPAPNYTYSSDADDPTQLTDGELAGDGRVMHSDKRAVGWAYTPHVRVTVDLGQVQPVGQVLWRQASLSADNTLPLQVVMSLSVDGQSFFPAGRISRRTHPDDNPALTYEPVPADAPAIYALALAGGYHARYVRLDIAACGFVVSDELAVLAGPADLPAPPALPRSEGEWLDNVFDRRDQYTRLIAPGNLAAGIELRYAPQPGYRLTTDPADPTNLTDGQFGERVDEKIWFEKPAVCWQGPPLVTLFADLGQPQPVSAVVGRFLGGREQEGLTFPDEVRVLLSVDGEEYYQVSARHKRGLDDASDAAYDLPEQRVAWVHNFALPVGYRARYVALQVLHQKQFICSDEVAIVRGTDDLPDFTPAAGRRVTIVTDGVAFEPVAVERVPIATMPLRCKLAKIDARTGSSYGKPCKLVLDVPETLRFASAGFAPAEVEHEGRRFLRYVINWTGEGTEFRLQSLLPEGETDTLYAHGDSGAGLQNERRITWESIAIPQARLPKRLHTTLAWIPSESLAETWPEFYDAMAHMGFNGIGFFPRYWTDATKDKGVAVADEARRRGFRIIQNESPSGALAEDRGQPEVRSQLPEGETSTGETAFCPSYRGQFYQKEHASFGKHAVWLQPDYIFYDIEAYWHGAVQDAARCSRCLERYRAGGFATWDDFRRAMGREIHVDMKAAIDQALAEAGIFAQIAYGSYRTEPLTELNDGIFGFDDLYPDLLQMAMPSLYVAGSGLAVAGNIGRNRAMMQTNAIVPWFSTGCYGEYEPSHTRDMILEAFANGANGITYYWYGHFDAGHFKYHAQAVDIVAPVEDIFMDGKPLAGLTCSDPKLKVCGMGLWGEMAVLLSNYRGAPEGTAVTVSVSAAPATPVWDIETGRRVAETDAGGAFTVPLERTRTRLYYVGSKYAEAVAQGAH